MKRWLFIGIGVFSIALAVAIVTMCVATRHRAAYLDRDLAYYRGPNDQVLQGLDQAYWQGPIVFLHSRRITWAAQGKEGLAKFNADHPPRPQWHVGSYGPSRDIAQLPQLSLWNRLGFHRYDYKVQFAFTLERHRVIAFPVWVFLPPLLAIGYAILWKHWWQVRRRRREGLCPICGYDVRATPERCPECGAELAAQSVV